VHAHRDLPKGSSIQAQSGGRQSPIRVIAVTRLRIFAALHTETLCKERSSDSFEEQRSGDARMMDGSGPVGARYRAFISYSHRDALFAARLHRRLEGYVLPKRLGAGRRLAPIFKDREELPAAHDLSAQVRAALALSDCLVVVCSPDAAASPWVGREIELFRELHPDRPVLAALVRGEPTEAFPPALSENGVEPLAADFRKDGDGDRLALLKLVAGIAGVGVDQLVQRDAQRRLRGVMAVTAVAVIGMLAMGGMTVFALNARAEAIRERAEADRLVEFMLTDLRDKLEGIGRLDVQTAVNNRALAYYEGRGPDSLSANALDLKARVLLAIGEDYAKRGDLANAQIKFSEAYAITEKLLSAEPVNPARLWVHGQSVFWSGYAAYLRKDFSRARKFFESYHSLTKTLLKIDPDNSRYLIELGYAEGNLCTLYVEHEHNAQRALRACGQALVLVSRGARSRPNQIEAGLDIANRHAWLSDAYRLAGDVATARRERIAQEGLLESLMQSDPTNVKVKESWAGAQRALARLDYWAGDFPAALARAGKCKSALLDMIKQEPANEGWRKQLREVDRSIDAIKSAQSKGNFE
jgi:tetratricopeptide (TPR) repeat protein